MSISEYEQFVLNNGKRISLIETTIINLSYLLQGRFKDSYVVTEIIQGSVHLAELYHDSIFRKHRWNDPGRELVDRYTGQLFLSNNLYSKIATFLAVLQTAQLMLEMIGQKLFGKEKKWKIALVIEFVKVICRLQLFRLTGFKLVPSDHPLPDPNRKDTPSLDQMILNNNSQATEKMKPVFTENSFWVGEFTKRIYPKLEIIQKTPPKGKTISPALSFITDRALKSGKKPLDLINEPNDAKKAAEILFIIRPLVYVMLVTKFGVKSWTAWSLSFIIEFSSYHLIHQEYSSLSQIEKDEHQRRSNLLFYYFLRSPLYDQFTKELLTYFQDSSIAQKPIINLVTGSLKEYMALWEEYYFYTSAS